MSNQILVTQEGGVTLVVEPQPVFQVVVESVPDIQLVVPPQEDTLIVVTEDGPQGPPGLPGADGATGPQGPPGADSTVPGPEGPQGPAGPGLPLGGIFGQLAAKASSADYDVEWIDVPPSLFRGEWQPSAVRLVDVPMTSGNTPAPYVATENNAYSGARFWCVFDQNTGIWEWNAAVSDASPVWGKIDLGTAKRLTRYSITVRTGYPQLREWKLQGSNDNATWVDVDIRTGQNLSSTSSFELPAPATYRYYMLRITGYSGGWFVMEAMDLWEDTDQPYMTGEYVIYQGRLYRSTVDNNSDVPETAGSMWTKVPLTADAVILASPNGTKFNLTVDDNGSLTTTAV